MKKIGRVQNIGEGFIVIHWPFCTEIRAPNGKYFGYTGELPMKQLLEFLNKNK